MNPDFKRTAGPYSVFVEEVEDHVGQTRVTPVPMNQEELLQVLKARKSKIAGHHRLHTQRENINQCDTLTHTTSTMKREESSLLCMFYSSFIYTIIFSTKLYK